MPPTHPRPITRRELWILTGIARGAEDPQIAERLGMSGDCTKMRVNRMIHRYGTGNRAGLIDYAYRQGWLAGLAREQRVPILLLPRPLRVILAGAAAGLPNAEIADRLGLSVRGVRRQFECLFDVLDARHRSHAVALGWQLGLLGAGRRAEGPAERSAA
ncbi:LuxR C-terminal-related transcriptional regulator [Streptomyces sp. NPDC051642]|uniref:LuxR C-terminal-related transcriptional regulator n=1 Tax=Streptomyces sp. NPDC051642 TaxID=3154646 RepID=UPI003436BB73